MPYTSQEIYDKVCEHLANQKCRAGVGSDCRYRMDDGKACAVGCLIPDGLYSDSMEGRTVHSLYNDMNCAYLFDDVLGRDNYGLLARLQGIHDDRTLNDVAIRLRLANAAVDFGLTPGKEQLITEWNG